mgnify:CR=1 FL=1|jgi:hypothetical protein
MFKTRKQLKDEIRRLETELYEERSKTRVSAFIESAGLPQCKALRVRIAAMLFIGGLFVGTIIL